MTKRKSPTPAQIKAARAAAGMTQAEAARYLDYSLRAVVEWEGGRRKMRPAVYDVLCLAASRRNKVEK